MTDVLDFYVNGERRRISDVPPTTTLLNWLRYDQRLTGTKEGCAEGDCGACTVAVRELDHRGKLRQRTVNACIQLLPMLHGKEVVTVEHLSSHGEPHPVQRAMAEGHGSQCGFCTPGFVMSLWHGYQKGAPTDAAAVADQLAGNLCRCTGYGPIIEAAEAARALPAAASDAREARARLKELKTASLFYEADGLAFWAPREGDTLAALIDQHRDAVILAGATDIGLWVTKQGFAPEKIIYLGNCADLSEVEHTLTGVSIPAAVTHERAMEALGEMYPDLGELWRRFASEQVRSAGTLCGNIANGSPIGDGAPALIAAGASVTLRRRGERRVLPLEDFFIDYGKQDLAPGEFVESIEVSGPDEPMDLRCYKISKRFDQDISAVLGAINVQVKDGRVVNARVAFGGMAATPKRALAAEAALRKRAFGEDAFRDACAALEEDFQPIDDHRASAAYRMRVAQNLLWKYFVERGYGDQRVTGRARVMEGA
ncbi:MAG: xanthine dehydrogenase small subunit [Pseudomonadota bacterium]